MVGEAAQRVTGRRCRRPRTPRRGGRPLWGCLSRGGRQRGELSFNTVGGTVDVEGEDRGRMKTDAGLRAG